MTGAAGGLIVVAVLALMFVYARVLRPTWVGRGPAGRTPPPLRDVERLDAAAALAWAADCVEHLCQSLTPLQIAGAIVRPDEDMLRRVAACVAFARGRAGGRAYDRASAERLRESARRSERDLNRLAHQIVDRSYGAPVLPRRRTLEGERWRANRHALRTADDACRLTLEAAAALCAADAGSSARRAAALARKAAAYDGLAQLDAERALAAAQLPDRSWGTPWNAAGALRYAPRRRRTLAHGGGGETSWQIERLREYLEPAAAAQPAL